MPLDLSGRRKSSHGNIHNRRQKLLWGSQKSWASCFSSPSIAVHGCQHRAVLNQEASAGTPISISLQKFNICHVRARMGLDLTAPTISSEIKKKKKKARLWCVVEAIGPERRSRKGAIGCQTCKPPGPMQRGFLSHRILVAHA